ncbi:helix-turn-helix domain-containing protein [Streptococcus mutans]|uniref:helix-turn-helix domain-containing protein n=1 Tax=Streptococcus mutans TaxID=1309 RepID=UPI0002B5BDD6|nr:helix-turn-helix transcriptional regulator [Streptococcus mutans]EMB68643.1 putative transcriptional regulator [Streptococcus mutans 2ST1]EMC33390.1 putative transcriptional regulator [Streptococcus mutans NLML1]EMC42319.1 putative transcriptional regulator [Streptococcus mutans SM1]MCB4934065.1 helix-turn-helix domain-containing protein [Streptococcus mutans]MCB4947742.1 helix-turn-helix domain-containing protein [Streptococcus mutans]
MFPERLKTLRLEAGLTQKQIAKKLHIKQQSYSRWENSVSKPSRKTLEILSKFFDVSTDYLLGKTNIKKEIPEGEELEKELDRAIDNSVGFEGKPVSDRDRETIKRVLREYFANQKKNTQ